MYTTPRIFRRDGRPTTPGIGNSIETHTASSIGTRQQLLAVRALLPLAAVIVSLNNPHVPDVFASPRLSLTITPTMLAMTGVSHLRLLVPDAARRLLPRRRQPRTTTFLFGPSFDTIERITWKGWNWTVDITNWLMPKTLAAWGVISRPRLLLLPAATPPSGSKAKTDGR